MKAYHTSAYQKNHLNLIGPSYSHAAALNWTYKHVVKNRKPTYFGFIDHDLFSVKNIDVKSLLKTSQSMA